MQEKMLKKWFFLGLWR